MAQRALENLILSLCGSEFDVAAPNVASTVVAGVSLGHLDLRGAVDQAVHLADQSQPTVVVTLNVDQALHVAADTSVAQAFRQADLRLADGAPIVALSKLLGSRLPARVTGADLMPALCEAAARRGLAVAILGGAPGVGDRAARRLQARAPGLRVVTVLSPPQGFERDPVADAQVIAALRGAAPQIVFVCLGSPRQELWITQRLDKLPPAVYVGVGAAVDFAAGRVRRAPAAWQRFGLEWLWRLVQEPRRLWRRYLVRGPRFLLLAGRELASRSFPRARRKVRRTWDRFVVSGR